MNSNQNSQGQKNPPMNMMLPPRPFDPTESVHEWTMWRAAVNRCIVNKVMSPEKLSPKLATNQNTSLCLLHVPLKKFIRLGVQSHVRAQRMSGITNDHSLDLNQFVYFGIPRPKVKRNVSRGFPRFPIDDFAARYV